MSLCDNDNTPETEVECEVLRRHDGTENLRKIL